MMYHLTLMLKELRSSFHIRIPVIPTRRFLGEFSSLTLTLSLLLSLIIATVFPFLLAIVTNYAESKAALALGTIGLFGVLATTAFFFFTPQLQLHWLLAEGKDRVLSDMSRQYRENERLFYNKLDSLKTDSFSPDAAKDLEWIISTNAFLVERMQFVQANVQEWAFDIPAILSLATSSLIPITTFVIQILVE